MTDIHSFASKGDIAAVQKMLAGGVSVDLRNDSDLTPLACAASSAVANSAMLTLLIDSGADVNASVDGGKNFPLNLAACSGSLDKVQTLATAGADVNAASDSGYTALINVMYKLFDSDQLVPMINLLLELGANTDCETSYGESPLSVSSNFGRFDAVEVLLNAGVDPSPLGWNDLMKAVALGTCEEVRRQLASGLSITDSDCWERTPWLLASVVGSVEKAKLLQTAGANLNDRKRGGSTALAICAENGNSKMLAWLLEAGIDIEAVDGADNTTLMLAAQTDDAECVRVLLDAGANSSSRNEYGETAISMTTCEQVMRQLIAAGEDIAEISTGLKRILVGFNSNESSTLNVTKTEYQSGCRRRFGKTNPEEMNIPFWKEMIRTGITGYGGKAQFDDVGNMEEPTWCFDRFGSSFTELPDGRFVQIGGEHEDHYDPDFCIYNDVTVHEKNKPLRIMGYPETDFPPTDFHSATFFQGFVYVIGSLGYHGSRLLGTTPVYRFNTDTWEVEAVETTGANPGWIYRHKSRFVEDGKVVVSGGKVAAEVNGSENHSELEGDYMLDLKTGLWTRP